MKQFSRVANLAIYCILLVTALTSTELSAQFLNDPVPGDIFKEFTYRINHSNNDFRVTDPAATHPNAGQFLPNHVMTMSIGDLAGAIRAEAVLDVWGGHTGTTNKRFKFNNNAWITIPELGAANGIPAGHVGQCYQHQYNPVVPIPLSHLVQGNNTFTATSGGQTCYGFNWGQWTWHEIIVRVYYNSSKPHPTGSITSPSSGATIGENPTVAAAGTDVAQVDFLAYYDGFDMDGDGRGQQYHHYYHRGKSETAVIMKGHVGTDNSSPFSMTWNTNFVPNQAANSVKLIARLKNSAGVFFITNEVTNLTLQRTNSTVRMYRTFNIPEYFWVRANRTTKSVPFTIPAGDNLANAVSANLMITTWNADDVSEQPNHAIRVNTHTFPYFGSATDHWWSFDTPSIPVNRLLSGANTFTIHATTIEHGIEVMWPGPAIIVRYNTVLANTPPSITQHPADQSVGVGQTATFSVIASGSPTLQYQWQKNNSDISGATGASYTTPPAVVGDNGATFRCVVTNPYGNATSNSATLTVGVVGNLPPTINTHPANQTVTVGQTATFNVSATGTAPLGYQWQKNNVDIGGATNTSYTTPPTVIGDNGATFRCVVTNAFGNATSNNATLTVNAGGGGTNILVNPSFASGTTSWTFYTNGAGSFSTVSPGSDGSPAARVFINTAGNNVQLYQSNITLNPATDYVLTFSARSTTGHDFSLFLQRHDAPFTNYGLNGVVVNLTSSWQSFSIPFTTTGFTSPVAVNNGRLRFWFAPYDAAGDQYFIDNIVLSQPSAGVAPSITTHPSNQTVTQGQVASFSVAATGSAPLTFQWQKNSVDIPEATGSTYNIVTNASDNGATFRCVVSNAFGTATSNNASLTVSAGGSGNWWNNAWSYRVPFEVDVEAHARTNKPAEILINFTTLLAALGDPAAFDENSIRVIEVDQSGAIVNQNVVFQFDKDPTYHPQTFAAGTLVFMLSGNTAANATRYFDVYFDVAGGGFVLPTFTPQVSYVDNVMWEGQASYHITTTSGRYYYHKQGAGFASMIDNNNNDWISYHPTGGSAGHYRGIPNLGDVFHPGYTNSASTIQHSGPIRLHIRSTSTDGLWSGDWFVYPSYAHFLLTRKNTNYWFLYEGTPGGTLNTATDFLYRSNGSRNVLANSWFADLASPEWVYFGDRNMRRTLFVVHHENDTQPDYYRHMENNMTVFGFGRQDPCCTRYMSAIPQNFTIGFWEDSLFTSVTGGINNAYQPMTSALGAPEVQPPPLLGAAMISEAENLPAEYALLQNFPNPFNPSTTINYEVPDPSDVRISVYDMLGQHVMTLVDQQHAAGRYQVVLNGENMSSGTYLYRMEAGSFVEVRRLVFLK